MNQELKEVEEQYLLRVRDPALAEELRAALRAAPGDAAAPSGARLLFTDSDRQGTFEFGGRRWPVTVLSLPSVVESYKTLDDTNLVKTTDIGQVLVVGGDQDSSEAVGEMATGEARDGVTPVMRNARERIFRRPIDVPPNVVQKVEYDLLTILAGGAPEGLKFVDTEEEWVVDAATGQGAWLPVKRIPQAAQSVAQRPAFAGRAAAAAAAARAERRAVRVAAATGDEQLLQQPALVLAGFYIEELATVRQLLDQVGADAVRVLPSTPAALHEPVARILASPEPAWDAPVSPDWLHGGGWGQQRMVLVAGLSEEQAQAILSLLADVDLASCPTLATPANLAAPLGQVLAEALKRWRQAPPAGGAAGSGAPAAAAEAAGPAPEVPFVEKLPPLEEVLPAEVWQPQQQQRREQEEQRGAGGGGGGAAEVVQAEFSEAAPAPPAAAAAAEGEGAPLDIIDAIASGGEPRAFASAGVAAGSGASADDEGEDGVALAEARLAMGLDAEEARRLVDGAAARAAEAAGVRFEGGGNGASSGAAAAPSGPAAAAAPVRNPASRRGASSGSRKPWEVPAAPPAAPPAGGEVAAGVMQAAPQASAAPSKGFGGTGARPSKGKSSKKGSRQAREAAIAGGAAAAAAAGSQGEQGAAAGAPAAQPTQAAAAEAPAAAAAAEQPAGAAPEEPAGAAAGPPPEPRPIPGPEAFVLSREQLRGVAERHGLDFGELLAGLQQRGINLAD